MDREMDIVEQLLEEGNSFTYDNFSDKGQFGFPSSFSPDWVAWQSRVESIVIKLFNEKSAQYKMLEEAKKVVVLGNGPDMFNQSKSYYLGVLNASLKVLKNDVFDELNLNKDSDIRTSSNEVFIVHGHDDKSKNELTILLEEFGLEPVVLHRKPDEGQTIIEKIEKYSNVGYAFIILSPDEIAYLADQDKLNDEIRNKEKRARPNVIFEFGLFVGKLGRNRVCCLYTGDVVVPSDINGLLYKKFTNSVEEVAYGISKELKNLGYKLK